MYGYLRAAALCMIQGELTQEEREEQIELMRSGFLFIKNIREVRLFFQKKPSLLAGMSPSGSSA